MRWLDVERALGGLGQVASRARGKTPVREVAGATEEEFELELAELGLSGRCFEPSGYAEALGTRLGVAILFRYVDPLAEPAALRRFAFEGQLAEARYVERANAVLITLPANLPPFLLELSAFHELAHVAAGDVVAGRRISLNEPQWSEDAREEQADARARHLYLAGSLGPENPYALRLHGVP